MTKNHGFRSISPTIWLSAFKAGCEIKEHSRRDGLHLSKAITNTKGTADQPQSTTPTFAASSHAEVDQKKHDIESREQVYLHRTPRCC
jgi:hypothetical protein